MKIRPRTRDLYWMAGGAIPLVALLFLALHYHREENLAGKIVFKASRLELVARMRTALTSASEAEKNAVMATTDAESRTFADQAQAASALVGQSRDELAALLEKGGTPEERELLSKFSRELTEYQRIDRELLDLAVQNTNLKAFSLTFGPGADTLARMDGALSRILKAGAASTRAEASQVLLLAADAQTAVWRIQALLPPHIAEENERKMDELEIRIAQEDEKVRSDLKGLGAIIGPGDPDLGTALASYAEYAELRSRILKLSRENTNVRSLFISMNQKKKAAQACQNALTALERSIQEEPKIEGLPVNYR